METVKKKGKRFLILLLIAMLICGIPLEVRAGAVKESNIAQNGEAIQLEAADIKTESVMKELEQQNGMVLFSTGASPLAANARVELTYSRTIQYENFFTRNFRVKIDGKTKVAYCVQPKETPPAEGAHTAIDYNNKLMSKALYYSWGYPGYDRNTKQYVSKKDDDDDWADDDDAYALCHMILSYLYDKSSADSDAFYGVSSDTIKLVKQVADKIENDWPDAPTDSSLKLNYSSVKATWDAENQVQETPVFRLTAHSDNRIQIPLPKGVKIHRTRDGVTKTYGSERTIKVYGGDTFYFTADKSVRGTWKTGNLEGSLSSFNPYLIRVSGSQDILFCGTGETSNTSFSVTWVEWGKLTVKKLLEDGEKSIDLELDFYDGIQFQLTGNNVNIALKPDKNGNLIDSNGNTTLELLPGTYVLSETSVPDRYREKLQKEIIITAGEERKESLNNLVKKGNFRLLKVYKEDLQDNESIVFDREAGVVFRVWDADYYMAGWNFEDVPTMFKDEITTDQNGEAGTKDLPVGEYLVQQVTTDQNHWKVKDFFVDIEDKTTTTKPITVIGNKTTEVPVKFIKIDAETEKVVRIAGIQFQVYDREGNLIIQQDKKGNPVDTYVTDANGEAWMEAALPAGQYQVKEIKAPPGYALADEMVSFSVNSETQKGEVIEVRVADKPQKVELLLHKQAETFLPDPTYARFSYVEMAMPFVKFDVMAAEDIETGDGTIRLKKGSIAESDLLTDEQGSAQTKPLYPGKYVILEKGLYSKVKQYHLKETDLTNIVTNWQIALQDAGKKLPSQIEREAFETALSKPLEQEFKIDHEGNSFWEAPRVTGPEYSFDSIQEKILQDYLRDLPVEQIEEIWRELSLDRYDVPQDGIVAQVELKADEAAVEITRQELTIKNKLKKGGMKLTKTDLSDGRPIPNTGIRIYLEDQRTVIFEGRTDQDGILTIPELPIGHYYFQEYDAPSGYLIDENLYSFTIQEGIITKCQMTNQMQMGRIRIQKSGESYQIKDKKEYLYEKNEALAGAEFAVIAAENIYSPTGHLYVRKGATVERMVTNQKGQAETRPLHLGKYQIKEIKIPEGYVKAIDRLVELKPGEQNIEVVDVQVNIQNHRIKGGVEISKVDVSTKEPLPNTGIRILDERKQEILKGRTDKDGKLTFQKMPAGIYYFQEFDAPPNYQLNEEAHLFEIKEDGEIVRCEMTNKANPVVMGNTPQTGDGNKIGPLIGILLLSLIALFFAALTKRRDVEEWENQEVDQDK
ncbi:SpaA isopeptide-forming pilin-related protein [Zhenpiania hominis]|uniref:LPXTG cell wall anchor domain-containing protein n=1 Tax=Zhenpiania hominis TaxID=2763644 RepID=A0A923NIA6_9FIRM|nr:SpaA isopeptide-forming pilin-related protein [Zhenpiania hominis]MBC6679548.1 LPXTG cell wall anchor domain-containing protein [Zhenpiania hominis]